MRRLLIALALVFAAPAAAATIHAPRHGGIVLGTAAADHIHGGPGNDFVQAAWGGKDTVDCGRGFNVVAADLGDTVAANCQVVVAPALRRPVDEPGRPARDGGRAGGRCLGDDRRRRVPGRPLRDRRRVVHRVRRLERRGPARGRAASSPPSPLESNPAGPERAASDPSVAYDAAHAVWLISTLTIEQGGTRVMVARSSDGLHWSAPVTAAAGPALDKDWIACDNGATSPFRGRCYDLYTDDEKNTTVSQSSDDGGVTWSTPVAATGVLVGTQPAVLPNGTLVTIAGNYAGQQALTGTIESFRSTDGGATFTRTKLADLFSHDNSPMRAISLPSLAIDSAGILVASWADCRFRASCSANDIVISTSTDGITWGAPSRVPLAPVSSSLDAMIPGIGADPTRPGHLALVYAYYTPGSCAKGACMLGISFVQSSDGGASWTTPLRLDAEPMQMTWLPLAEGRMVGDYFATAFAGDRVVPVFALAIEPTGGRLHEGIFASSIQALG